MRTKVQKWGNSLAVRLPKSVADQADLKTNDSVDIAVEDGKVVILPRRHRYLLSELLKGIRDDNLHEEIDTGTPVGRELW